MAIALALQTKVIAQKSTQDEVLFGAKEIQWLGRNQMDGCEAFRTAEIEIDRLAAGLLCEIVDAFALQSFYRHRLVAFI